MSQGYSLSGEHKGRDKLRHKENEWAEDTHSLKGIKGGTNQSMERKKVREQYTHTGEYKEKDMSEHGKKRCKWARTPTNWEHRRKNKSWHRKQATNGHLQTGECRAGQVTNTEVRQWQTEPWEHWYKLLMMLWHKTHKKNWHNPKWWSLFSKRQSKTGHHICYSLPRSVEMPACTSSSHSLYSCFLG